MEAILSGLQVIFSVVLIVLILGLLLKVIALPIAARRVVWLSRLITSGQPDPGRVAGVTGKIGRAAKNQLVEVFAQPLQRGVERLVGQPKFAPSFQFISSAVFSRNVETLSAFIAAK